MRSGNKTPKSQETGRIKRDNSDFINHIYLSICAHLSLEHLLYPPLTNLFSASSSLSPGSIRRLRPLQREAIQVNIINSSFNGAHCERYGSSLRHPSCLCSPRQQPAEAHRWASALPWNELESCACAVYTLPACFSSDTRGDDNVWCRIFELQPTWDKVVYFSIPVRQNRRLLCCLVVSITRDSTKRQQG